MQTITFHIPNVGTIKATQIEGGWEYTSPELSDVKFTLCDTFGQSRHAFNAVAWDLTDPDSVILEPLQEWELELSEGDNDYPPDGLYDASSDW